VSDATAIGSSWSRFLPDGQPTSSGPPALGPKGFPVLVAIRAALEAKGVSLSLADSQIAGQALAAGATLVSSDSAFRRVPGLTVRNWSK